MFPRTSWYADAAWSIWRTVPRSIGCGIARRLSRRKQSDCWSGICIWYRPRDRYRLLYGVFQGNPLSFYKPWSSRLRLRQRSREASVSMSQAWTGHWFLPWQQRTHRSDLSCKDCRNRCSHGRRYSARPSLVSIWMKNRDPVIKKLSDHISHKRWLFP